MMEKEGFVELRANKGFYVQEIGSKEVEELFDIRETLEILAIRRAVENQSAQSIKRLRQALENYAADVGTGISRRRLVLDQDFHLAIAEVSENQTLGQLLEGIFSKIYLKHKVENLSEKRGAISKEEHEEIFQDILSGNAPAAIEKMRKHISSSRKNILGFLREEETKSEWIQNKFRG